jgi:hypothetical protein
LFDRLLSRDLRCNYWFCCWFCCWHVLDNGFGLAFSLIARPFRSVGDSRWIGFVRLGGLLNCGVLLKLLLALLLKVKLKLALHFDILFVEFILSVCLCKFCTIAIWNPCLSRSSGELLCRALSMVNRL